MVIGYWHLLMDILSIHPSHQLLLSGGIFQVFHQKMIRQRLWGVQLSWTWTHSLETTTNSYSHTPTTFITIISFAFNIASFIFYQFNTKLKSRNYLCIFLYFIFGHFSSLWNKWLIEPKLNKSSECKIVCPWRYDSYIFVSGSLLWCCSRVMFTGHHHDDSHDHPHSHYIVFCTLHSSLLLHLTRHKWCTYKHVWYPRWSRWIDLFATNNVHITWMHQSKVIIFEHLLHKIYRIAACWLFVQM